MWVYINSSAVLLVGHYDPSGKFVRESECATIQEARARVHYLNGGASGAIERAGYRGQLPQPIREGLKP